MTVAVRGISIGLYWLSQWHCFKKTIGLTDPLALSCMESICDVDGDVAAHLRALIDEMYVSYLHILTHHCMFVTCDKAIATCSMHASFSLA